MKRTIILLLFIFSTISQPCFAQENLWEYIADNFQLDHQANRKEVKQQIRYFQNHQAYLRRVTKQAQPYMYYITQIVEKHNLPGELVLLPVIESAYDPFAHSWVGAAGLWQFMPATATDVGVKQNWWYDGRRDVISSTDGALKYLTYLNRLFKHNWQLAVASYNCGEGSVQRAVKYNRERNLKTDFWSLKLPYETRSYVPRLLALAEIVKNPKKYHIKLEPLPIKPYFTEVDIGFQINLAKAAKMANISLTELYSLNPGYNRWSTDPDGPHKLLLPISKLSTFEGNLIQQTGKHSNVAKHTVQDQETLEMIAKKYHTNSTAIKLANHIQQNSVTPAQVLLIPKDTHMVSPSLHASRVNNRRLRHRKANTYIVKSGDSLWKIANNYKLTVNQLMMANKNIKDNLRPGQHLKIPNKTATG